MSLVVFCCTHFFCRQFCLAESVGEWFLPYAWSRGLAHSAYALKGHYRNGSETLSLEYQTTKNLSGTPPRSQWPTSCALSSLPRPAPDHRPLLPQTQVLPPTTLVSRLKVESTHATPRPEEKAADAQAKPQATGTAQNGVDANDVRSGGGNGILGGGGGVGKDAKSGVKVQHRRRRSTTGLEGGRKAASQQRGGVGYPMTAVSAVLRQLHMRVLSGEEMKMLDQVRGGPGR